MKLNLTQFEAAFLLVRKTLENQDLPDFMKNRWLNALAKAKARLLEQPFFAWQTHQLSIVSIPQEKSNKTFARFYQVNDEVCHRLDKVGYCQAFYEGFPCWHRATFLLLGIYFGYAGETRFEKAQEKSVSVKTVNQS